MNNILISNKISNKIKNSLISNGFKIILLPDYIRLDKPVMSHADMLIYKVSDKHLLTYQEYYESNRAIFDGLDCRIAVSDFTPCKSYPHDIALNALKIRDTVYGREESLAKEICMNADHVVNVKQGYAKCSCLQVADDLVITSDESLYSALKNNGIDVLKISSGNIGIEQYNYGFIGGASFTYGETVYFFGNINKHPDGDFVVQAINHRNKKICCLSDDLLYDYGGAVII